MIDLDLSSNSGPSITTKHVVLACVCDRTLDMESDKEGDPVVGITTSAEFDMPHYV